jgi:serine/threonine protein kinase
VSQPYSRRDTFLNRMVGRYRLVEKIGSGGMGSVYKGVHTEIPDLVVAVKLLAQSCVDNDSLRQRFRDEASICARLGDRSPNIVQIRDYGILDELDLPYYAMEYLQGRDLEELIRLDTPLLLEHVISIVQQLCEGLNVAHEQGVIHRDLKSSNIYLIPDAQRGERVKILDFGIAKFLRDAALAQTGPLTQGYMGTPRYSSPEQLQGKEIGLRSDLYTLGLILYELFAGSQPFAVEDDSFASWYRAHNELTPQPMAEANPRRSVPADIEQVILRCLAKDPKDRPHSSLEISQQLERAVRKIGEESRRQEDQQVLDSALQLTAQGLWSEASALVQSIAYNSPLYPEAQTYLKNWQLEVEYQRVFEQARLLAQENEISSLVRAVSIVETIPSTSVVYRTAHAESQRWIERVSESAEDLARAEKWSEALQRAELISTLPGSQRLSPLILQWRKEEQAADVLRKAESLAAERRWEQAIKQLDSIPVGTVNQPRALQRRPLWQKEIQAQQALEQADRLASEQKYDEAISRVATVISGTVFDSEAQNKQAVWKAELAQQQAQTAPAPPEDRTPSVPPSTPTAPTADRNPSQSSPEPSTKPQTPLGLWIGGGLAALAAVAAVFILNTPKPAPVAAPKPTPSLQPAKTAPETLGQKFLERAQAAAQEKRWRDCLWQINQLQGLTIPQNIEASLRTLGTQCSAGQLTVAKDYIGQQKWQESYESLKSLLTLTPKSSEAAQAQQQLQKVSDNWANQLLLGAIKNAKYSQSAGDRPLLLQAIATAAQVPREAKRYPEAQELMKKWKNALKTVPESAGSPNPSKNSAPAPAAPLTKPVAPPAPVPAPAAPAPQARDCYYEATPSFQCRNRKK